MKLKYLISSICTFFACVVIFAETVDIETARKMTANWLRLDSQHMEMSLAAEIVSSKAYYESSESSRVIFYCFELQGGGYVIASPDDDIEPVIAFSGTGILEENENNPLWVMLNANMTDRVEHVRSNVRDRSEFGASPQQTKWQLLLNNEFKADYGIGSISDIRVPSIVKSKWNQSTEGGNNCYNYFTPNNYVCGCVATAMAQVIRFYEFPVAGIGVINRTIYINGSSVFWSTRGGDGSGGAYNYPLMTLDPDGSTADTNRQQIGSLTLDSGVAVSMNYTSSGSGADTLYCANALRDTFGYSNAIRGVQGYGDLVAADRLNDMANPNLDSGRPVILGITGAGGHAIVCDGYGYNAGSLYHHLNMGWGGSYDAWYNLPDIDTFVTFNSVYKCVYNIYPSGSGELISGRVTDSDNPVSGKVVTATYNGTSYTDTTNARGVYAIRVPSGHTYSVACSGYDSQNAVVGTSVDNGTTGNVWGVDFTEASSLGAATLSSPSGTIADKTPTFEWSKVDNCTHYLLWVRNAGGDVIKKWYSANVVESGGRCSVTSPVKLGDGDYTWWVQTHNAGGNGPLSTSLSFSVSTPPSKPSLIAPNGSVVVSKPEYSWNTVNGATHYLLWVRSESGDVFKKWYSAVFVTTGNTCLVTPDVALSDGSYSWWVTATNAAGNSPLSNTMSFNVQTSPPAKIILNTPSGTISDTTPTYSWQSDSTATHYMLWVRNESGDIIKKWYTADSVTSGVVCSATPSTTLTDGTHSWWVQARNESGNSPLSDTVKFTVSVSVPGKIKLSTPSGTISDRTPTYSWQSDSTATHYMLWVRNGSSDIIKKWYTAASVTSGGSCSVRPSTTLGEGVHSWWIQASNSGGKGPLSNTGSFTIDFGSATPGKAILLTPKGLVSETTPTYRWNACDNTTHYLLWVRNGGGDVIKKWFAAENITSGTTCSVTPSTVLSEGSYTWWIQTLNGAGTGPISEGNSFEVDSVPGKSTLADPSGTVSDTAPIFKWSAVPGATHYYLLVRDSADGDIIGKWYTESAVTSGSVCSARSPVNLSDDTYTWWIRTYNAVGWGPWSNSRKFKVSSIPGKATLRSPSGTISTNKPRFEWDAVSGSTNYFLWVRNGSGDVIKKWYAAENVTSGGLCSVASPSELTNGSYSWWIQTHNSSGNGPLSSGMSFTVDYSGFDSDFNSHSEGWSTISGSWSHESSQYFVCGGQSASISSIAHDSVVEQFDYTVRVRRDGSDTNANRVQVRGDPGILGGNNRWSESYLFQYTNGGYYSVWKINGSSSEPLQSWTTTSAVNAYGWNTMRVITSGSRMFYYLNGALLWSGVDTTLGSGRLGIGFYSDSSSGEKLSIDWARMTTTDTVVVDQVSAEQQKLNDEAVFEENMVPDSYNPDP